MPSEKFGLSESDLIYIKKQIATFNEIRKAVIFGSRAMGNFKEGSDIDIAIFGEQVSLKTVSSLQAKLQEEGPLPYLFDIVHYESIEQENLKKHIDEFGVEL